MLLDVTEVGLEFVDAADEPAAVGLELCLAGTAGADAGAAPGRHRSGLLGERTARLAQAWEPIPQQRQLDLGLALHAGCVLGEDVEDHRGAVDGRATEQLLEVELLGRRELVVEHDGVAVGEEGELLELLCLALADVGGRIGRPAPLHDAGDLVGPGGVDERAELVEPAFGLLGVVRGQGHADEHDLLPEGPFDQCHQSEPRSGCISTKSFFRGCRPLTGATPPRRWPRPAPSGGPVPRARPWRARPAGGPRRSPARAPSADRRRLPPRPRSRMPR